MESGRNLLDVDVTGTEYQTQRVSHVLGAGSVDDGTTHLAASDADETLCLEDPERLPDRWPTDAELVQQVLLFGQLITVLQFTVQNAVA